MRGWLLALLATAACYSPRLSLDAPCSSTDQCPIGQQCVAGRCGPPGDPGGPDAPPPGDATGDAVVGDRDHDGIPDTADNCANAANPDQGNEDGDKFGDACDPCPPVADNAPLDSDGDGVADACDPNPTTPGDHIELFEGFHRGLPSWARSPNWTVVGDAVRGVAAANTSEYLVAPITNPPGPDHITLSASVVVESEVASTNDHDIDVAAPNDVVNDNGIDCELYQPGSPSGRYQSLWDDFPNQGQGTELGKQTLAWVDNAAYTIALTRRGQSYTCAVTDPAGARHVATGSSGSSTSQPTAIVRAYAVTARVNWVMVVRSP